MLVLFFTENFLAKLSQQSATDEQKFAMLRDLSDVSGDDETYSENYKECASLSRQESSSEDSDSSYELYMVLMPEFEPQRQT